MSVGQFLTPLITKHIGALRKELVYDLVYKAGNGDLYVVPAGFYSDGASVPRMLWWLYPPFGEDYEPAAWLHDWLYVYAERVYGTDPGNILSRAEADGLFDEAMESLGFRKRGRRMVFNGVRLGGWKAWRQYRQEARQRRESQET